MNCVSNAFSKAFCNNIYDYMLHKLHKSSCHISVTRLHHFVCIKNLLHYVNEVCNVVAKCEVCSELIPNFYKLQVVHVVKAFLRF